MAVLLAYRQIVGIIGLLERNPELLVVTELDHRVCGGENA
jgi:hypothetical protein